VINCIRGCGVNSFAEKITGMLNCDEIQFNVILAGRDGVYNYINLSSTLPKDCHVQIHYCSTQDEMFSLLGKLDNIVLLAVDIKIVQPQLSELVNTLRSFLNDSGKLILVSEFSIQTMMLAINAGFDELMVPPLRQQQISALLQAATRPKNNSKHLMY